MRAAALAAAVAWLAACSKKAESVDETAYAVYEDPKGRFEFEVPQGWTGAINHGSTADNVQFLLQTYRPGTKDVVNYALVVYYYPPKHPLFKSADAYVQSKRFPYPGWKPGPVSEVALKGGSAKRFTVTLPVPGSPEVGPGGTETETFAVLPVSRGFFVMYYASPEELHTRYLRAFDHLVESFEAKL